MSSAVRSEPSGKFVHILLALAKKPHAYPRAFPVVRIRAVGTEEGGARSGGDVALLHILQECMKYIFLYLSELGFFNSPV